MKQLRFIFFALLISIIPYSCSEDSNHLHEEEISSLSTEIRKSDREETRSQFYQFDYVADYLGLEPTDKGDLELSAYVLSKISKWRMRGTIEYEFTTQYGTPAWSLSKVDAKDGRNYVTVLTPIVNTDTQRNIATLVTKLGFDGNIKKVHLYDRVTLSPQRWIAFEPYFNELSYVVTGKETGENSLFSRFNPCQEGINCWCKIDIGECVQVQSGVLIYCNKKCSQFGSGGSDGEEEAPLGTDWSEGANNNGTSSTTNWSGWDWEAIWPPIINPNIIDWNGFNVFNGVIINNDDNAFNFPEGGYNGSDVEDPTTGNENIMDPYELYFIQMKGFINHYNLTMTVDQLSEMLPNDPESCAGLKAEDFYNCARFNLITDLEADFDLQLTEKEKWYLFNNFEAYENITNLFANKGKTAYTRASASIYLGLGDASLLDLTYSQAYSSYHAGKLKVLISNKLEDFGLEDQASVDPATWFMMIKKEASSIGGDFVDAFLYASEKAINQFWNEVVSPIKVAMAPIIEEVGDQFPQTDEEWRAMMAIFGPMLLEIGVDIGTDFIPVVGELKAMYKCGDAITKGKYGDAAIEFICGVAGIIPIGDIIKGGGKVIKAGAGIFVAFKAIKILSKITKSIFSTLIQYAKLGWKIAWDSGLKKMIFKSGDDVVGRIDKNGVPDIASNFFKSIIDVKAIKYLVAKPLINGSSKNYIQKSFINSNANQFNVTDPALRSKFDDIVANGDQYGKKTENLLKDIIEDSGQSGYKHFDGTYGSNNGFDGVFINESTGEVIINEGKQWTGGSVGLSGKGATNSTTGKTWPAQMTDEWVDAVSQKLIQTNDSEKAILASKIIAAKGSGLLTKIVTVVDRTATGNANNLLGGINIIKVK